MSFEKEPIRTPAAIADLEVRLYSPDPLGTEQAGAFFSVQVRYNDGSMRVLTGDLLPHISAQRKTSLNQFMNDLRQQAIAEILP